METIYLMNTVPSPSVTMYALDPVKHTFVRVTIDYDGQTIGKLPVVYIETGLFEKASQFAGTVDVAKREYVTHFLKANEILLDKYLEKSIRPIPADI